MIKRVYVHDSIYESFRDRLVAYVKNLPVGDGTQQDVFFGPLQNEMQYHKARDLIGSITTEGLRLALGGTVNESDGFFIHPAIIDNPPDTARVVVEEAFAPILPLMRWYTEEEVLARVNAGPTGLGGSVWCRDLSQAQRLVAHLECGSIWVNSHFAVAPHVPFGGCKEAASVLNGEWMASRHTAIPRLFGSSKMPEVFIVMYFCLLLYRLRSGLNVSRCSERRLSTTY